MAIALAIPPTYGYSVLIACGLLPAMAVVHGSIVTGQRPAAGVKYPNAYATAEQCKNNKAAYTFNCAQRAHGNYMENMPQTLVTILFAGLFYPRATPVLGTIWAAFRALYLYGYVASDQPDGKGRKYGGGFWFAQLGLMGLCIKAGWDMLV